MVSRHTFFNVTESRGGLSGCWTAAHFAVDGAAGGPVDRLDCGVERRDVRINQVQTDGSASMQRGKRMWRERHNNSSARVCREVLQCVASPLGLELEFHALVAKFLHSLPERVPAHHAGGRVTGNWVLELSHSLGATLAVTLLRVRR